MIDQQQAQLGQHVFLIPAAMVARLTKPQHLWVSEHVQASTSLGLEIDLERLTLDELYELDTILAWVERHREEKGHGRRTHNNRDD